MKPIIGLNTDINNQENSNACYGILKNYITAIESSGAIPLLVPPMSKEDISILLNKIDAMLFIGGNDYNPNNYGEAQDPSVELIDPEREKFDFLMMTACLQKENFPILGICGGMQLMNLVLNGSLIQDIKSDTVKHGKHLWHQVNIKPGTKLHQIYDANRINVPTNHHQAINKLGNKLTVNANADDDIIEGVEIPGKKFVLGVQWHPERDYEHNKSLFMAFVQACKA